MSSESGFDPSPVPSSVIAVHPALADASRLPWRGLNARSAARGAALLAFGALAAAGTCLVDFKLRAPGHAILRAAVPMALGLALVPRKFAGTFMGAGAMGTLVLFRILGWGDKGLGATTSLLALGPMLDLAVARVRSARGVAPAVVAAGVLANLAAFGVQLTAKSLGLDSGGGKSVAVWMLRAAWTYPTFGALAGLLGGLSCFRWTERRPRGAASDSAGRSGP